MRENHWIGVGALSAGIAVALGAFGAHALKETLEPEQLETWNTAVQYHVLHALALIGFGLYRGRFAAGNFPGWAFLAGSVLFSGSLYGLALGGPRFPGADHAVGRNGVPARLADARARSLAPATTVMKQRIPAWTASALCAVLTTACAAQYGYEVQGYPAGIITGPRIEWSRSDNDVFAVRPGYNFTDRSDFGDTTTRKVADSGSG